MKVYSVFTRNYVIFFKTLKEAQLLVKSHDFDFYSIEKYEILDIPKHELIIRCLNQADFASEITNLQEHASKSLDKPVTLKLASMLGRFLSISLVLTATLFILSCNFDPFGGDDIQDYNEIFDVSDTGTIVQYFSASKVATVETDSGPIVDAKYNGDRAFQAGDIVDLFLTFEGDQENNEYVLTDAEIDPI